MADCARSRVSEEVQRVGSLAQVIRMAVARSLIVVLAIVLSACAAFRGAPKSVIDTNTAMDANKNYLTGDPIGKFNSSSDTDRGGLTKRQWRDTVIGAYIEVIDLRYNDFKQE